MADSVITIGLADDHPILRQGLFSVINLDQSLDVVWQANNGQEVLELTKEVQPDIIILDINMPILDGIQTAEILSREFPNIKLVFLSMFKDSQIFDSMKHFRVKGYLLKDSALVEIVACIKTVSAGNNYLTQELFDYMFSGDSSDEISESPLHIVSNLTPTEKQVLQLVSESQTSREIAEQLFISVRTVENHRQNICKKFNLHGNHALIKFALEYKNSLKNTFK